jgi:tetratricopeptide (TPR) repeat protein
VGRALLAHIVGVVAVLASAGPVAAQAGAGEQESMDQATTRESDMADAQARGAFRLGRQYYEQGRFAEAAAEFERAYGLSGRAELLYNAYLAYRDAQDEEGSARTLRGYLAQVEQVEDRPHLEARLQAIEAGIAERRATSDAQQAATAEAQRQAEEARRRADEAGRPRYRTVPGQPWPWVITGVGGAMVIVGVITGAVAMSERSAFDTQCTLQLCPADFDLATRRSNLESLAITTDVLLIDGGVVVATGVILGLLFGLDRSEPIAPEVSASCTGDGCIGLVRGEF